MNEYCFGAVEAAVVWHPELFEMPIVDAPDVQEDAKKKKKKKRKKKIVAKEIEEEQVQEFLDPTTTIQVIE
jgi:hypothetical protein